MYSQNVVIVDSGLLPLAVGSGAVYDIISNTHVNCFGTPRLNNTTIDNISKIEEKCSICIQLIPKLCGDLKKSKSFKKELINILYS